MSKSNELIRINDFFYNLNENTSGIIDRVEYLPVQINKSVFICGMRLLSSSFAELHVKTIRNVDTNIMSMEQVARMIPESESWVDANTFSEETLKRVLDDFIRQTDKLTDYNIVLTKWCENHTTIPQYEITLFNSKKTAYKEIMRVKRTYDSFLCTYKLLDKYARLITMKTFKNLTAQNNTTTPAQKLLTHKTTQEHIMTDLELVTCNINNI